MADKTRDVKRRDFLAAGAAFVGVSATEGRAAAADMTAAEQANVKIVNDFCAAWSSRDLEKVMAFFAETGAYRMTETMPPAVGREAVSARVKTIIDRVDRFEVLETFARGPMVVNERIDRFSNFTLKTWRGVGVFFLKDGKIAEWYDYTIAMERA